MCCGVVVGGLSLLHIQLINKEVVWLIGFGCRVSTIVCMCVQKSGVCCQISVVKNQKLLSVLMASSIVVILP